MMSAGPYACAGMEPTNGAKKSVKRKHVPVTRTVKQGDKVFYRARYAGFEAKAAASACGELKRLKIDCLVLRAD